MLIECPECKREISDQAASCPHCGFAQRKTETTSASTPAISDTPQSKSPVLLIIALIALLLGLFTPRILIFFPVLITLGCATVSLVRKEAGRPLSIVALIGGVGLLLLSGVNTSSLSANLGAAKIADWNWNKDPSFGTRGAIKWNVEIQNVSTRSIRDVRVELTTYDASGKLVATDFTYVNAIPPGQTRSQEGYGDLYGTEEHAEVKITDVNFSD